MDEHRVELGRAMTALGLKSEADLEKARAGLPRLSGRWRWIVTPEETRTLFSEEPTLLSGPRALSLSPVRMGSCNWDARFKTLSYLAHVQAWRMAATPEVVLLNEQGHIASVARGNIFWRHGERFFTPAHEAGCRCGVVRGFVLHQQKVEIGHFPLSDLAQADEIFVTNSLIGIVSIQEMPGRIWKAFPGADRLREKYAESVAKQLER